MKAIVANNYIGKGLLISFLGYQILKISLSNIFRSKAKIVYLNQFVKLNLEWVSCKTNEPFEYELLMQTKGSSYYRMPIILQSNSLPWHIGNAYLVSLLSDYTLATMKTVSARAIYLKYYLQYLEDTDQHFLDLPKNYYERVTQKFKLFMMDIMTKHDFSTDYINNILSTVAHFYTQINYHSVISEDSYENKPFHQIYKKIVVSNEVGLTRNINVITNDLRIKNHRQHHANLGRIRDGGNLRPLNIEEQKIIFDSFNNNLASIELELMMRIAMETGARQQTVCTLSVGCIQRAHLALESNLSLDHVIINAGQRFKADAKQKKHNRLVFSRRLIEKLINYIDCERAQFRRSKNSIFDIASIDNYIFLTRDGSPYYTAEREIVTKQNQSKNRDFKVKSGQSLRNELNRFIERIQKQYSNFTRFTFHDLRATSGMNIVRSMREKSYPDSKIFDRVRQHLNHRNIQTTELYLNFDDEITEFFEIQDSFGSFIGRGAQ